MTDILKPDNFQIGEEKAFSTLYWLHRFGGLTSRQLAMLVWPDASQGMQRAQKKLLSLAYQKMVQRQRLRTGGWVYYLTASGARFLIDMGVEDVREKGQGDLKFLNFTHRSICNYLAIERLYRGETVWTEHEIQRRLCPVSRIDLEGRRYIPDLITYSEDTYDWYEVENSPKSLRRLRSLLTLAERHTTWNSEPPVDSHAEKAPFHSTHFILPNDQSLKSLLRVAVEDEIHGMGFAHYAVIHRVSISPGLVWHGELYSGSINDMLDRIAREKSGSSGFPEVLLLGKGSQNND